MSRDTHIYAVLLLNPYVWYHRSFYTVDKTLLWLFIESICIGLYTCVFSTCTQTDILFSICLLLLLYDTRYGICLRISISNIQRLKVIFLALVQIYACRHIYTYWLCKHPKYTIFSNEILIFHALAYTHRFNFNQRCTIQYNTQF